MGATIISAIITGRFLPSISTHKRITIEATGVDFIIDIPIEIKLSRSGRYTDIKAKMHPKAIPSMSPMSMRTSESNTVFQKTEVTANPNKAFTVSVTLGNRKSYPIAT